MKVLVVDDSAVFRMAITQALEESDHISKVLTAANGEACINMLNTYKDIDLITLDLEMPVMDGISTIKEVRKLNKEVGIVIFSSESTKGAEKTIEALSLGANDFVTKQELKAGSGINGSLEMIRDSLIPKVKSFKSQPDKEKASSRETIDVRKIVANMPIKPKLIVIGSSTGGPEALGKIFSLIDRKPTIPILIVQHMPKLFTEKLASHLNNLSSTLNVRECKDGDSLKAGECLLAPGDFHMFYENETLKLNQDEKVCFVRPSVDVLVNSLCENYDGKVLSFVLTGMGNDGAASNKMLAKKDNHVFIQNKESCIVWGMPSAVNELLPDVVELQLEEIAEMINLVLARI